MAHDLVRYLSNIYDRFARSARCKLEPRENERVRTCSALAPVATAVN